VNPKGTNPRSWVTWTTSEGERTTIVTHPDKPGRDHLLADHIAENTPPRRSDEEASARGFWIALGVLVLWVAVVAGAGLWRGCG